MKVEDYDWNLGVPVAYKQLALFFWIGLHGILRRRRLYVPISTRETRHSQSVCVQSHAVHCIVSHSFWACDILGLNGVVHLSLLLK